MICATELKQIEKPNAKIFATNIPPHPNPNTSAPFAHALVSCMYEGGIFLHHTLSLSTSLRPSLNRYVVNVIFNGEHIRNRKKERKKKIQYQIFI